MIPFLDWVAVGFTVGQMYLLGHRKTLGWPVGIVACGLWIVWASDLGLWSIVVINTLLAGLAARGWYKWRSRSPGEAEAAVQARAPILPMALGSIPASGADPRDSEGGPVRRKG